MSHSMEPVAPRLMVSSRSDLTVWRSRRKPTDWMVSTSLVNVSALASKDRTVDVSGVP